jgi:hypothetical protein
MNSFCSSPGEAASRHSRKHTQLNGDDHFRSGPALLPHSLFYRFRCVERGKDKSILLSHVIYDELVGVCEDCKSQGGPSLKSSELATLLKHIQEAVVVPPRVAFSMRLGAGDWHYLRVNIDDMSVEEMSTAHYLAFKEKLVPLEGPALVGKPLRGEENAHKYLRTQDVYRR